MIEIDTINAWIDYLRGLDRAPDTIRIRRGTLVAFASDYALAEVAMSDVVAWIAARPGGPARRQGHLAGLRGFYRWAVATGRLDHDPTTLIPGYHVPRPAKMPAPEHILAAGLSAAGDLTRRALLLGAYQGLRRAEIAAVHSDDVTDGWLTVLGKGQRRRRIPIHPLLRDDLAALDGWAFPSPRCPGEHVSPGTIARWITEALGDGWTPHSLRRRLGTRSYRASRDIRAVQQILGHASVATTQLYVYADEDSLIAALGAVA